MDKVIVAAARGIVCVLTLATLSACNFGGSNDMPDSIGGYPINPPPVGGNPGPTNPPPGNSAPQIAGSPATQIAVGESFSFRPNATDADGDSLTFNITSKPAWASFNSETGRLWGTPDAGDVGSHEDIMITVSDGSSSRALPQFAINVVEEGTPPDSNGAATLAWQAPTQNTDGSPLLNLKGYKIHYGKQSGHYDQTIVIDNSSVTRYVIENLESGTYFFAISSVAGNGSESGLSGEASKTI